MMPRYPVSHLIVPQTGFSFGSLEAFFDAMSRLGHPSEFLQRDVSGCIRQIVIKLVSLICLTFPSHKQYLLGPCATRFGPTLDPTLHRFDHQRPFLSVPHIDLGPSVFGKHRAPVIHSQERRLGISTSPRVLRRWHFDVTDQRVRWNRKQISFALSTQIQAKTGGTPHLIVARDPGVRQYATALRQHLRRQLMASLKFDRLGYTSFRATRPVLRPIFRKIKTYIDQRLFNSRHVTHVDPYLAVLDLAQSAAP